MTPERLARRDIDRLLKAAGWNVCDVKDANIHAARGVAVREFPLKEGFGFVDYMLYVDAKEAYRSIYNLWRQVLVYFHAYLIGLTATLSKQTFGFFNQNLMMEYDHEQAAADGIT